MIKLGENIDNFKREKGGRTLAAHTDGTRAHGQIRARAAKDRRAGGLVAANPARAGARLACGGDGPVPCLRRHRVAPCRGIDVQAARLARAEHLRRQRGRDARFGRKAPDAPAYAHGACAGAQGLQAPVAARGIFGEPARRDGGIAGLRRIARAAIRERSADRGRERRQAARPFSYLRHLPQQAPRTGARRARCA